MSNSTLAISPHPDWPLSSGVIVRNHHLLLRVAPLCLVCRGQMNGPLEVREHLASHANRWRQVFDPWLLARMVSLVRRQRVDRVLCCTLLPAVHGVLLKWITGAELWLDLHNVESQVLSRLHHPWARAVGWVEAFLVARADRVTCVSAEDARLLARWARCPVEVFPNGADAVPELDRELCRRQLGFAPEERVALFFGVLDYPPNREALDWLVREFAPRWAGRLVVCGVGARPEVLPANVDWRGYVTDLAPVLRACDLSLVPLLSGGGTRLKVLESLSAGLPVLSTPIGVEGLPWQRWPGWVHVLEREGFATARVERPDQLPDISDFRWESIFSTLQ